MKTVISVILALVIGYFVVGAFYWVLGQIFWMAITLTKLIMALFIALPFFLIIRKKLLK